MDLPKVWLAAAIVIVIISTASSQTIQQLNSRNPSQFKQMNQNIRRTKHNNSNVMNGGINSATESKMASGRNDDTVSSNDANTPHSRKKRLIWITDDGRLALPPGTVLSITPTISLPLVRYPLEGFLSNMTMSFPLTIDFDKLGLTDNENPLGVFPPLFARSMGRAAGSYLGLLKHYSCMVWRWPVTPYQLVAIDSSIISFWSADYIGEYLTRRKTRSIAEEDGEDFSTIRTTEINPTLPDEHKHAFHGGERAILYGVAEDLLTRFGMDGKACMLRIICEIHSKKSLDHLGLFGEIAKLFFTYVYFNLSEIKHMLYIWFFSENRATKSNYAHMLTEYVTAQRIGEGKHGPGECFPYYKKCPKSIFKMNAKETTKYRFV